MWADRGFKCCLDAKVILLSEEPCGFISCRLAEPIWAMLKLAVWAGKFLWVFRVLCPCLVQAVAAGRTSKALTPSACLLLLIRTAFHPP